MYIDAKKNIYLDLVAPRKQPPLLKIISIVVVIDIFSFEIIYVRKITFEFLTFKTQNFQMTSDRETMKTKVVGLYNIYNLRAERICWRKLSLAWSGYYWGCGSEPPWLRSLRFLLVTSGHGLKSCGQLLGSPLIFFTTFWTGFVISR